MALRLTPDTLRAAYEYLRATPPFDRWSMPHHEYVQFVVSRSKTQQADYVPMTDGSHRIRVSEHLVGHTVNLIMAVAHEMCHMRQEALKTASTKNPHNASFRRLAAQVCRHHGFDLKAF